MMDASRGAPSDPVSGRKPVIFQASHENKTNQRAESGERTVQRTFTFWVFSVWLLEPSPGLPAPLTVSRSGVLPPPPSIGASLSVPTSLRTTPTQDCHLMPWGKLRHGMRRGSSELCILD